MSSETLKIKITKSLHKMDEMQLEHAYNILKQILQQQQNANIKIDKKLIDAKINKGIEQLDKGEGTDFKLFLNEMQEQYGKKK